MQKQIIILDQGMDAAKVAATASCCLGKPIAATTAASPPAK